MKKMILAIQFLTIAPFRSTGKVKDEEIGGSSAYFVLVGLMQGALLVLTDYLTGMIFHHDLVFCLILLVLVFSNGGFHLDGLADTVDALAAKSTGSLETDRARRLSIMKDSATGPAGATAIMFSLALKYFAMRNISHLSYFIYYFAILFMPIASKWAMVAALFHGKPARENGLGSIFLRGTGKKELAASAFSCLFLFLLIPRLFGKYAPDDVPVFSLSILFFCYLLSRLWTVLSHRKFGGLTGDTLGALSEITEVIFLLMVIAWSRLFF